MSADEVNEARGQAARIAAALAGHVSAVVAAIDLNRLRPQLDMLHDDLDFETFMVIDSECDALPFGTVRQDWSAAALAQKEPQLPHAEKWAMETGKAAFTNVIARFAPRS